MFAAMSKDKALFQISNSMKGRKIGIVRALWNEGITQRLLEGAQSVAKEYGVECVEMEVPGSFELPLAAQHLARKKDIEAVVCLGCVIRGDTSHYDYVCQAATQGILQVGLQESKPIIFGVITVENKKQAYDRAGGKHGNKGAEGMLTALTMLNNLV